ncbi:hypothetical protein [Rhodoblastus sp.]|uniref:hypothetical protein n=1 Tax=Rhodoblastus sp. TaxID=1962975 RepID=UPI003F98D94A
MSEESELLAEIAREWNRIERRAKEVENFRGEAVVASINEMRYAGRRIVDYYICKENNQLDEAKTHLRVARAYLNNADHDLTDAVIFFVHQRISDTEDRHGAKKIEEYCPPYVELKQKIREAHKIIQCSREERQNRIKDYDRLAQDYIPRLIELHEDLTQHPELTIVDELERSVSIVARVATAASVASILGLLVGIWSIWLVYHPPIPLIHQQSSVSGAANSPSIDEKPGATTKPK